MIRVEIFGFKVFFFTHINICFCFNNQRALVNIQKIFRSNKHDQFYIYIYFMLN